MNDDRARAPRFSFGTDPPARRSAPRAPRRRRGLAFFTLLVVVAVVAAAAYVYVYRPESARAVLAHTPLAPSAEVTRAYKWRDADGGWHLTDRPPPGDIAYETVTVRSDTNVLPAVPVKQEP